MVRGDVAPILHGAPARPRFNAVDRGVPDLLTPNDVLEAERATIVHHPLGHLAARRSGHLYHPSQSVPMHLLRARRGKDRSAWAVKLTPPPSEHIKSIAFPQQWSDVPGQAQSRVQ